MNKFDSIRQQSLNAWAPAQKRWQQDQQKHPNFLVQEAQSQNENEAAAAGAAGFGGGGGRINLPLISLQTTTFSVVKSEGGNYFYTAINHTTSAVSTESDSGINSTVFPQVVQIYGDALGYSLFVYRDENTPSNRILQYVSPTGQIITDYAWTDAVSGNNVSFTPYYGGGVSAMIWNSTAKSGRFMYWFNGVLYQKIWAPGQFFGVYSGYHLTESKGGTAKILVYADDVSSDCELWVFGPGVGQGYALKGEYTSNRFSISTLLPYPQYLPVGTDGRLLNNADYFQKQNWVTIQWDSSGYATSLELVASSYTYATAWDCLPDIKTALVNEYGESAIDTDALFVDEYDMIRSGNDIVFTIIDDSTGDSYICSADINARSIKTVSRVADIILHNAYSLLTVGSTFISSTITFNQDAGWNDFHHSNVGYFISAEFKEITAGGTVFLNVPFYWSLPGTLDGHDLYIYTDLEIASSETSITLLAYLDNDQGDFYKITLNYGNVVPTYTVIPNFNTLDSSYLDVDLLWNDIKNEWFTKLTNRKSSPDVSYIEYLLLNNTTAATIGSKTTIDLAGKNWTNHGLGFVPAMLHLQEGPYIDIWTLDYNTYTWSKSISSEILGPTGDAYLYNYWEPYDFGYLSEAGGSRWVFIDPDTTRCWYITSKYGVQQSNSIPLAFIFNGYPGTDTNSTVGQVYSAGVYNTGDDPGLCITEVSTGQNIPVTPTGIICGYQQFVNDRLLWISDNDESGPAYKVYLDMFIGDNKTTFEFIDIWWAFNDVFYIAVVED
jgi:hypothetical protein